jgi:hypothetical protein
MAAASPPRWLRLAPAVIVLWLVVSWPVGLLVEPDRLTRPGELAYLVADLVILLPLAAGTSLAFRKGSMVAPGLLIATFGALAYDATHFAVRTASELESAAARLGVIAALLLLLTAVGLGLRIALRQPGDPRQR